FYTDHTLYARASAQLGARWQVRAKGEVRFREYGGIHDTMDLTFCGDSSGTSPKPPKKTLPPVGPGTDYMLTPWLLLGASYIFQNDTTDFFVQSTSGTGARDYGAFNWHEVDVRLGARW